MTAESYQVKFIKITIIRLSIKCDDNLINNAHLIVDGRKLRPAGSMVAEASYTEIQ